MIIDCQVREKHTVSPIVTRTGTTKQFNKTSMKSTLVRWLMMGVVTGLGPVAVGQTVLFTTTNDFNGWSGYDFSVSTVTSPDLDGSSVNGLGNTTAAGDFGAAGSLRLFETAPFSGAAFALSPNEATNSAFMSALLSAGTLTLQYETVPSGNESSLQLLLAYRTSSTQNGWSGITPAST